MEEKQTNPAIESLKKEINELKGKITTFEGKMKDLVSKRDELISRTVLDKKNEIEKTYSEILTEAEKRLSVSKKEKDAERKKNIATLVDKNTKDTRQKIEYLQNEIKRVLKENKLPGFVNSEFYFTMWAPYNFIQVLKGLLFNILLMVIPTLICFVFCKDKLLTTFPNRIFRIIIIVCIYLIFIFVFSFIWLMIDKMTKKPDALNQIRELRKNIKENKKEVEKITKKTTNETTDAEFDYTKLDRDIESGTIEVNNIKEKMQMAYDTFSNVTENDIKKKISDEAKPAIDEIEKEIENTKELLKTKQKEYDDLRLQELNNGNSI